MLVVSSRKVFVAMAAALAAVRPTVEQFTTTSAVGNNTFTNGIAFEAAIRQWRSDRNAVASVLATTNPLFNRQRFIEATEA